MKRNIVIELIKKFWEGKTSLSEEETLFSNSQNDGLKEDDRAYFRYITNSRITEYSKESEIWNSIVLGERSRKKKIRLWLGIAASILLIVSVSIFSPNFIQYKNIEKNLFSGNLDRYYDLLEIENGFNPTLYVNGCKSLSDYKATLQNINPNCIQHMYLTNDTNKTGKLGKKNGIVEIWLKGKSDEIYSICEGTLYFNQDGEIKSISIDDDCSPNLLVDCFEKPLSEIVNLKPKQIKSIELTKNPCNCEGNINGEYIVMRSK